jgi:hypothetical protein
MRMAASSIRGRKAAQGGERGMRDDPMDLAQEPEQTAPGGSVWRGIPGLLQIDGLVAAALVELGAPYFVRALMLGWPEADERPQTHVEITHGF